MITAVDYHTAGEPFRIVTGGVRPLEGETILAKRRDALEHLDDVRRLLVHEPRGHADMYGCFVTGPEDEGADLGVVFFHNEGYSTACGHGTIALVTWALESGRLAGDEVVVDAPSGRLRCTARRNGDRVESVRFRNVPSFVLATGVRVGDLELDVAFGGAFYASLDVSVLGLEVAARHLPRLIELQRELRPALDAALDVVHPLEPELRGIYGLIFHQDEPDGAQRNVAVFADGEVDRSPCGSGTSARLALLHAQDRVAVGEPFRHRSIVDTEFVGRVVATTEVAGAPAVVTEVEGSAYQTGRHEFVLADDDPLGTGFLLR
jgi:proline racemase/trans-L-3-hydroxyproline dehydratase